MRCAARSLIGFVLMAGCVPSRSPEAAGNESTLASSQLQTSESSAAVDAPTKEQSGSAADSKARADGGTQRPLSQGERSYLGAFSRHGVDHAAGFLFFEDRSFCFGLTAGNLDLLVGGQWQGALDDSGIEFREDRAVETPPLSLWVTEAGPEPDPVEIALHVSLSEAPQALLGVSDSPTMPNNLRKMFPDNQSWSEFYRLPPFPRAKAKYLFIGLVRLDSNYVPTGVDVHRFSLEGVQHALVGYDSSNLRERLDGRAQLDGDELIVNDSRYARDALPDQEQLAQIRADCERGAVTNWSPYILICEEYDSPPDPDHFICDPEGSPNRKRLDAIDTTLQSPNVISDRVWISH